MRRLDFFWPTSATYLGESLSDTACKCGHGYFTRVACLKCRAVTGVMTGETYCGDCYHNPECHLPCSGCLNAACECIPGLDDLDPEIHA
jgi:hypothetical protein